MLDFNSKSALADKFTNIIDQGFTNNEKPRDYLGGSAVGETCERAIQYQYLNAPGANEFEPRIRRIFQRGHSGEDLMAIWIKQAGFDLRTEKPDGYQFGFEDCDGKFKGHIDGVIVGGPDGFKYPALWENKVLGAKGWRALVKHGLLKQYPKYAAQLAVYQAYMRLAEHPAVFTALNADTMEIHTIFVPFDGELAQQSIDKAARVLTACDAKELLPRAADDLDHFVCKFCSFKETCWK